MLFVESGQSEGGIPDAQARDFGTWFDVGIIHGGEDPFNLGQIRIEFGIEVSAQTFRQSLSLGEGVLVRGSNILTDRTGTVEVPVREVWEVFLRVHGEGGFVRHCDFGVGFEILHGPDDHHITDKGAVRVAVAGVIDEGGYGPDSAGGMAIARSMEGVQRVVSFAGGERAAEGVEGHDAFDVEAMTAISLGLWSEAVGAKHSRIHDRCSIDHVDTHWIVGAMMEIHDDWKQEGIAVHFVKKLPEQFNLLTQSHNIGHGMDEERHLSSVLPSIERSIRKGFLTQEQIASLHCSTREKTTSPRAGFSYTKRAGVRSMVQEWRASLLSFELHLTELVLASFLLRNAADCLIEFVIDRYLRWEPLDNVSVDCAAFSVLCQSIECLSLVEQGCSAWLEGNEWMFDVTESSLEVVGLEI